MNRMLKTCGLAIALLASLACSWADERILSFDSQITVQADTSLAVRETIRVRAEGNEIKRGIYREFPRLYLDKWGLRQRTGFQVTAVRRDGQSEPFHTKNVINGTRVYIGQEAVLLPTGEHLYELEYRTDRQLGFFADHDELYWNVTGNGWTFPIDQVTATVILPERANAQPPEAYTGPQGSKGRDYAFQAQANQASFRTTRALGPNEGLTIVVSWPKGFVAAPTPVQQWLWRLRDNPGLFVGLAGLALVLFYYSIAWTAVGRDPTPGVIIPLYAPPKSFSPAAVRFLSRMGYDNTCFAAALLGLAAKGAISIDRDKDGDYTLIRQPGFHPEPGRLEKDEQALFSTLFGDRSKLPLVQVQHGRIREAKKTLAATLASAQEKVYFVRNLKYFGIGLAFSAVPMGLGLILGADTSDKRAMLGFIALWLSIWTIGVTALLSSCFSAWRSRNWGQAFFISLFSLPFLAGECVGLGVLAYASSFWGAGIFGLGALMNGAFYHLLKAPTLSGRRILDQIDGFRLYLSVAEKDRLNLENPPERTPELFEQFLPYALALGVEQQWSEQFAEVLAQAAREQGRPEGYSPSWAQGSGWSSFTSASLGSSLGASLSSAISSASTAPGSSSGSSSGGGGGGCSGGGGGGGGGGGW